MLIKNTRLTAWTAKSKKKNAFDFTTIFTASLDLSQHPMSDLHTRLLGRHVLNTMVHVTSTPPPHPTIVSKAHPVHVTFKLVTTFIDSMYNGIEIYRPI